jgi:hypothetical protein
MERHPIDWEQAYEDALADSALPQEDEAYLLREVEDAGGFLLFAQRHLRRLEEAASASYTGD